LSKNSRTVDNNNSTYVFLWLLCTSIFCKIIFQSKNVNCMWATTVFSFPDCMIYFRLGRLQNSKAVSTWTVMFLDKTRNVHQLLSCNSPCTAFQYSVMQMSDEILCVNHCSNTLIYNILHWQIKTRQTIINETTINASVNSNGAHPPPPGGISHFWKEKGYVPTPRKEELC
jgi:hypothetical protein